MAKKAKTSDRIEVAIPGFDNRLYPSTTTPRTAVYYDSDMLERLRMTIRVIRQKHSWPPYSAL